MTAKAKGGTLPAQNLKEVAVIIGPQADHRIARLLQNHGLVKRKGIKEFLILREQYPRAFNGDPSVSGRVDQEISESQVVGNCLEDRGEVEVRISDVDSKHTLGPPNLGQLELKRFLSKKVNGDRIAREGVDGQQVELLWFFATEFILH